MLRKMVELDVYKYLKEVLTRVVIAFLLAYSLPLFVHLRFAMGMERLILVTLSGFITCLLSVYFAGFSSEDKLLFVKIINEKILRKNVNGKQDIDI